MMRDQEKTAAMLEEIKQVRVQDAKVKHRIKGHAAVVTYGLEKSHVGYFTECIGCGERRRGSDKNEAMWRWEHAAGPCKKPWNVEAKIDEIKLKHLTTGEDGDQITLKSLHEQLLENQRKLDCIIQRLGLRHD